MREDSDLERDLPVPAREFDHRLAAARETLGDLGVDCAVLMAPETQYWLSGYDTFLGAQLPQALVLTPDGADALVLCVWDADVAIAHESALIEDIRTYLFGVEEPTGLFARVVRERATAARRIGVDLSSQAVNHGLGEVLRAALAPAELVDVTRQAGAYARAGLDAALVHANPGISETALAAEIEYAMRKAGSDYWSIPTEMTSGPRSLLGHGTPGARVLEAGDLLHVEIGGCSRRYNCVGMQTFAVAGAAPAAEAQALYDVALACLRAGLDVLKPGVPAAEVERPALEILRREGRGDAFKMRFGYGVGIGYPPSWLEPLKITRTSEDVLVPGMTFVLHACLLDEVGRHGVLVGGTYTLSDDGYELLSGAGDVALDIRR